MELALEAIVKLSYQLSASGFYDSLALGSLRCRRLGVKSCGLFKSGRLGGE